MVRSAGERSGGESRSTLIGVEVPCRRPGDADAIGDRPFERLRRAAGSDEIDLEEHPGQHLGATGEAGQGLLVVDPAHDAVVARIERDAADQNVRRIGVRGHREEPAHRIGRDEVPDGERPPHQLGRRRVGIEHEQRVLSAGAAGEQSGERAGELAEQAEPNAMTDGVGQ